MRINSVQKNHSSPITNGHIVKKQNDIQIREETHKKKDKESFEKQQQKQQRRRKSEIIQKTLSEEYPGLDYLGFDNVLNAKHFWYRVLWFSVVTICLLIGLLTIFRRGRCFRSIELYQRNFDELGKLRVQLRQPYQMDLNLTAQEEIMVFIAEYKPQLAPFPRYYLHQGIWTKMRLNAKHISLFPAEEVCSQANAKLGKDTCYVENWLQTHVEGPLNCTFPYIQHIRKDRKLNRNVSELPFVYRIDLSYNDLQYELIEEVSTLTLVGLIAQIAIQNSLKYSIKMPSPSSLLFSTIPIVCLLFNSCFTAPHPCCPGSQHVVALMTNYIGTFSAGEAESTVCASAENVVNIIKSELNSMPKCKSPNGGGSRIVAEIDAQLTTSEHMKMEIKNEDVCAYNLGFVRAMFEMAKSAAEHAGNGTEWNKLTKDFGEQITAINALSTEHTIFLTNVRFQSLAQVPSPSDVSANPGEYSAAN
ncbi:hypothetical protein GPALN_010412 [Globodera pallida]|nr:hypothetical protein GPALN_010412 [Globodera pallida]